MSRVQLGVTIAVAVVLIVAAVALGVLASRRPPADLGPAIVVPAGSPSATTSTVPSPSSTASAVESSASASVPDDGNPVDANSKPATTSAPQPKPKGAQPVSKPPAPPAGANDDSDDIDEDDGVRENDDHDDLADDVDDDSDDDD